MDWYPVLHLGAEASRALEMYVRSYSDAVRRVLSDAKLDEPIASVCLDPGQEDRMDTLPFLYLGTQADRDRLMSDGLDDWSRAWNPFAFREWETLHPAGHEVEGLVELEYVALPDEALRAWDVVRRALDGRCLDPAYWVHAQAARHLNRQSLPVPATSDFAVWVFEFNAGQGEVLEMLRAVLRPETFAALEASGLIGEDEEASRG